MALRGVLPEKVQYRAKFFLYGPPGCGKSTKILEFFPRVYMIDTEAGSTKYRGLMEKNKSAHFGSTDVFEVTEEVRQLMTTKHPYLTLAIDPITNVFHHALELGEKQPAGSAHGAHYGYAAKFMRRLNNFLVRLDMNVVVTAHQKDQYNADHEKEGVTFDAWGKSGFLFDYIFRMARKDGKNIVYTEKQRIDPTGKTPPLPDSFEWNYETFARHFGAEIMSKETTPEVMASAEKVANANALVSALKIEQTDIDRWLSKANADSFADMTDKQIDSVIAYCNKLVDKFAATSK